MKPKSDIARPGVVPGEILTLSDFCYRLKLGRHGWSAMLRRATKAGHEICFKQGRQLFVDTTAWIGFLKEMRISHAGTKGIGRRSVRRDRAAQCDGEPVVCVGE